MSKYHAVSSGMVTRQALPSITRQRGTVTGTADIMIYGAGKTTATNNITFLDSSANNFTVTRIGDTVQSGFNPFNQASAGAGYFEGTTDYLTCADNAAFAFGTGDFTVEYWIYPTALPGFTIIDTRTNGFSSTGYSDYITSAGKFGLFINATTIFLSTASIPTNAWTHVSVTRSGTSLRVFFNGVQQNSTVTNSTAMNDIKLLVGAGVGTTTGTVQATFLTGYLTNVRLVKGTAVYTSNFTPPTSPLTAISGTSLLLLMDNYVAVSSGALSYPLTNIGTTAPVISTAQFPTGMSSSIYFNGSGGLQTPVSANLAFGTGAYTMECWFYQISRAGSNQGLIGPTSTGGVFILQSTGQVGLWTGAFNLTSIGTSLNTWYHVAVVRQSNSQLNIYINGTSYYQTTNTTNYTTGAMTFGQDTAYLNGYMSNIRVVKGAAIYTTNFTVPTAPLPVNISVPAFVTNNIYGLNQIP